MFLTLLSCKRTLAQMDDYLDRELSSREKWEIAAHLKICHACTDKFEFQQEFILALRERLRVVVALEDLWDDISGAIANEFATVAHAAVKM